MRAIQGERWGEGGVGLRIPESRASLFRIFLGMKSDLAQMGRVLPPHPNPLPQHEERVGGEGTNRGDADPGRRDGLLPSLALG